MKFVKNDWRSRLGERNLTDLMLVNMEPPSIQDFDPEPAVQLWYTSGQRSRRPNYMEDIMNCSEPVVVEREDEDQEVVEEEELEAAEVRDFGPTEMNEEDDHEDLDMSLWDIMALQRKKNEMFCQLFEGN